MYIIYFRISKLKFIFSYTHIYIPLIFRVVSICDLSLSWHNSLALQLKIFDSTTVKNYTHVNSNKQPKKEEALAKKKAHMYKRGKSEI